MKADLPASRTPALDFLRKVEVWQQAPGGTAGIAVAMPEGDEKTLHDILNGFRQRGETALLETQARYWLIGYRENQPPLTDSQRAELDAVIAGLPGKPEYTLRPYRQQWLVRRWLMIALAIAVFTLFGVIGVQATWRATHPANNVPQGSQVQQHPPAQQVPAGTTDLQNFKSDWGPWKQLSVSQQNPYSGAPALLFMEQGGYYASERWTIPVNDPSWLGDLSGNITNVSVQGNHALITDADGNLWTVTVNQPFVFARNPNTVLRVGPTGTVYAIPEAHAISVRKHL